MAGMSGIGGAGGVGAVGAGSISGAGMGPSTAGASNTGAPAAAAGSEGVKVTISAAAQKMSQEATQVGASFSVTQDGTGHQYVNGMDANGVRAPGSADSLHNASGQLYSELNKLTELTEAAILALLLNDKKEGPNSANLLAGAMAVQAINAYMSVSQM